MALWDPGLTLLKRMMDLIKNKYKSLIRKLKPWKLF